MPCIVLLLYYWPRKNKIWNQMVGKPKFFRTREACVSVLPLLPGLTDLISPAARCSPPVLAAGRRLLCHGAAASPSLAESAHCSPRGLGWALSLWMCPKKLAVLHSDVKSTLLEVNLLCLFCRTSYLDKEIDFTIFQVVSVAEILSP